MEVDVWVVVKEYISKAPYEISEKQGFNMVLMALQDINERIKRIEEKICGPVTADLRNPVKEMSQEEIDEFIPGRSGYKVDI